MVADLLLDYPWLCAIMPTPSANAHMHLTAVGAGGMIVIMLANKFLLSITTRRLRRTNRPKHRLASRHCRLTKLFYLGWSQELQSG